MPTIHIYDARTREYLKTLDWTPPNEWVALPADATTLQPLAQREGFARVLNLAGDVWEYVEDHRGKEGFIEGQPHTVRDLGPLPAGWSDAAPEKTIDEKIAMIESDFYARENELKSLMVTAMISGDADEAKAANLRLKWSSLAAEKNAAIEAALLGV